MPSNVPSFILNSSPGCSPVKKHQWLLLSVPLFTLGLTNSTNHSRKLSVRRGNPLGVLWVICWCGTWAAKHPGALQQRRVTVMLSSFTTASVSANRPALPLRWMCVETITEQTTLQVYLLWYLIRFVWLFFSLCAFGFCPFFFIPAAAFLWHLLLCWWVQRIYIMRKIRCMFETWGRAAPWNRLMVDLSEALMSHWFHLLNPLFSCEGEMQKKKRKQIKKFLSPRIFWAWMVKM